MGCAGPRNFHKPVSLAVIPTPRHRGCPSLQKFPSAPLQPICSPHSQALDNIDLAFVFFVLPFQECHRNGILTVGPFESLASFSYQTFLRFTHLFARAVVCSTLPLSRVLSEDVAPCICSLVNGHWGYFQFPAVINKTAIDIHIQAAV